MKLMVRLMHYYQYTFTMHLIQSGKKPVPRQRNVPARKCLACSLKLGLAAPSNSLFQVSAENPIFKK
jgi:hypothetical protein